MAKCGCCGREDLTEEQKESAELLFIMHFPKFINRIRALGDNPDPYVVDAMLGELTCLDCEDSRIGECEGRLLKGGQVLLCMEDKVRAGGIVEKFGDWPTSKPAPNCNLH